MKKKASLLAGLIGLISVMFCGCVMTKTSEASAVGVIGGADGPTAIFTASNGAPSAVLIGAVILGILILAGVIFYLRSRKKK